MNVFFFSDEAQIRADELRRQCSRLQTLDLRIASIPLLANATLLNRNLRDFRRVPGLTAQDWTA
jgi:tRNA(fMet)-specific endonuclease VapC